MPLCMCFYVFMVYVWCVYMCVCVYVCTFMLKNVYVCANANFPSCFQSKHIFTETSECTYQAMYKTSGNA